jgi:hypothetical protein
LHCKPGGADGFVCRAAPEANFLYLLTAWDHVGQISREPALFEGEDIRDALNCHRCNESSVMGLLPGNAVRHKSSPFRINIVGVGKRKTELSTHVTHDRPGSGEAEPVTLEWPRADGPEFNEILRSDADAIAAFAELGYGVTGLAVLRVGTMKATKDDVGIGKNVHYRFQLSSRV